MEKTMPFFKFGQIRDALHAADIPPNKQDEIMQRLRGTGGDTAWTNLLRPLKAAIRTTSLSRTRWRPSRVPTYDAYLQLMRRVEAEITNAARDHASPADYAQLRAQTNAAREAEGKRPLGDCLTHWSTWVPPHIREATILAFEKLYTDETAAGMAPGRRIHPFSTLTQRGDIQRKWKRLLDQLMVHIKAGFELDPAYVEAHTRNMDPDRAQTVAKLMAQLHRERYRAAYAARKIVQARMKDIATNHIVPVHWVHLLDEDTREHLRAAERAAGGDGYTRDVGVFFDPLKQAVVAADIVTPGYIASRPDDKRTAAAAQAQSAMVKRQAELDAQRQAGDDEWERRLQENDL
jgi:hypothetical protein